MRNKDHPYGGKRAGRPHPDAVIAELAARQAGIVERRQLLARGITRREIERRLASGHLVPVHRGVYAVGGLPLTASSRRWAAVLVAGDKAALSHLTALDEHDIRRDYRIVVDVTIPRRARVHQGLVIHRAHLDENDITAIDDRPVTSLPRTLLDVAATAPPKLVTRGIERADKLDLLDVRKLDAVCERYRGHHGERTLTAALKAYDPRHHLTRSGWERDVLDEIDARGMPRPQVNARLGPYEFDLYWPEAGVVVELNSWQHHGNRPTFENDHERALWLTRHDILLISLTWRQVKSGAIGDVARILERRLP